MSKELTFTDELGYLDDPTGITIPVMLTLGGSTIIVAAKVDTGAEVCLFGRIHGEELGLRIEQGIPKVMNTLSGSLESFGHEVVIQTGQLAFHSLVYFAKYPGLPRNILGRQGWLRSLKLGVVDYDNLLYLSPYDSKSS